MPWLILCEEYISEHIFNKNTLYHCIDFVEYSLIV